MNAELKGLREIVEHAKTKTPCASNYECLLADLMGLLSVDAQVTSRERIIGKATENTPQDTQDKSRP